jgi:hypothetical protein
VSDHKGDAVHSSITFDRWRDERQLAQAAQVKLPALKQKTGDFSPG